MAKEVTSVRLEKDLLGRIDAVAENRGESRSQVIEGMLTAQMPNEEQFVRDMEKPMMRALARAISYSPGTMQFVMWAAGEGLSEKEIQRRLKLLEEQATRGEERSSKTSKKRTNTEGA